MLKRCSDNIEPTLDKGGAFAEGPDAVVKSACLESQRSRVCPPLKFQGNKIFLPRSLVKIQYYGEPLRPRGSVLGLRPTELEFRIMCLERSVSFISPSSEGFAGSV